MNSKIYIPPKQIKFNPFGTNLDPKDLKLAIKLFSLQ